MANPVVIGNATLYLGDCLEILPTLPSGSVQTCVTSPPYYGLRDYGVDGQIGLESTLDEYVAKMVEVFREVRRVLQADGTLWLNLGDSYAAAPVGSFNGGGFKDASAKSGGRDLSGVAQSGRMNKLVASGLKPKDLCMIPARVALALQADGWYLRSDIIWHKPNPMPESVTDRPTKAHEYLFLLAKSERYYYDAEAIAEPFADERMGNPGKYQAKLAKCETPMGIHGNGVTGQGWNADGKAICRNRRTVWTMATQAYSGAHFATFPPALIEPCIMAGCPVDGIVLDPFNGSGTTGLVALENGRRYIGCELNEEYIGLSIPRIENAQRQIRMFA